MNTQAFAAEVPGVLRVQATGDLDTVWQRLQAALQQMGIKPHALIDHGAAVKAAGIEMGGARLAIFGNPAVGGHLMQAAPEAAMDLPLKVLVWEGPDGVVISYSDPHYIAKKFGADTNMEALKKMRGLLDKVVKAAAGQ